ncbi:MAG: type II toxin-antitoxin system VapC family toxin [Niveispirillum sp.]|uniref:type II toxin-antitoxin system VapC family toxin n=1 Tax=Niveispirillum sp. TaxID=1917217 RepID=UPI00403582DC
MPFVLDASMAASWAFGDESSTLSQQVLIRLTREYAVVPALWWFEMLNIVAMNERRGRLSADLSAEFLALLHGLDIEVDQSTDQAVILSLVREYRLTAYDAAYLEPAVRERLPLATFDRELAKAAQQAGVTLLTA